MKTPDPGLLPVRPSLRALVGAFLCSLLGACGASPHAARAGIEAPARAAYPLGTLTTVGTVDPTCPTGHLCQGIVVSCPGLAADIPGVIAVSEPSGTPRGVVVFFEGGPGTTWPTRVIENLAQRLTFLDRLRSEGFRLVQVRWSEPWLMSSLGEEAGFGRLACRPATVVKWVHEQHFLPLKIARSEAGRCGFCITGNSGGSTQVAFALSHYGLDGILDAVIPTGGPPHTVLSKACVLRPGDEGHYWTGDRIRVFFDKGFGFFSGTGPCARGDASYAEHWNRESVATGGSDYHHPRTRVHLLVGEVDAQPMLAPATFYAARLREAGSPSVALEIVPGTGHNVTTTQVGRDMLTAALLAGR